MQAIVIVVLLALVTTVDGQGGVGKFQYYMFLNITYLDIFNLHPKDYRTIMIIIYIVIAET